MDCSIKQILELQLVNFDNFIQIKIGENYKER